MNETPGAIFNEIYDGTIKLIQVLDKKALLIFFSFSPLTLKFKIGRLEAIH